MYEFGDCRRKCLLRGEHESGRLHILGICFPRMAGANASHSSKAIGADQHVVRLDDNFLGSELEAQSCGSLWCVPLTDGGEIPNHTHGECLVVGNVTVVRKTLLAERILHPLLKLLVVPNGRRASHRLLEHGPYGVVHPHERGDRPAAANLKDISVKEAPRTRFVKRDLPSGEAKTAFDGDFDRFFFRGARKRAGGTEMSADETSSQPVKKW